MSNENEYPLSDTHRRRRKKMNLKNSETKWKRVGASFKRSTAQHATRPSTTTSRSSIRS